MAEVTVAEMEMVATAAMAMAATAAATAGMILTAATSIFRLPRTYLKMKFNTLFWWIFGLAIVIAVLAVGVLVVDPSLLRPAATATVQPVKSYAEIVAGNGEFAQGEKSRLSGDYASAIPELTSALAQASTPVEEGMIKLRLALSEAGAGNPDAIPLYETIAADTSYNSSIRAYAVEDMIIFLMTNGGRQAYMQKACESAPYASMCVQGDVLLTYRNLAEYASSIYPIADSELLIAVLYADDVQTLKQAKQPDTAKIQADVALINAKVASANADLLVIMKENSSYLSDVPYILLQETNVYGKLQLAGENSSVDPDVAYQAAIKAYSTYIPYAGSDGFARFHYATYLADKNSSSASKDIHAIISPLYLDPSYTNSSIKSYLANIRVSSADLKAGAVNIARLDAGFKNYLGTLGWTDADFK